MKWDLDKFETITFDGKRDILYNGDELMFVIDAKKCSMCPEYTNWISINFEGFICSSECLESLITEYSAACEKVYVSDNEYDVEGFPF
jgi:hypothetical protein